MRIERRRLLKIIAKVLISATTLSFLSSIYFLKRGAPEQVNTLSMESVFVCEIDEIPEGSAKNFDFRGSPGILVNLNGFHAYIATCPHMGCPVSGRALAEEGVIECPCHGSKFEPATGRRISGPAPRSLTPIRIEIRDKKIFAGG
jgi:nitrite reductase/ring-hydroxylating ferredoxin subunit